MQNYNFTLALLLTLAAIVVLIIVPFSGFSSFWVTTVYVVGILFIIINIGIYLYLRNKKIKQ